MIGKRDKALTEARAKSHVNGQLFKEVNGKARQFLSKFQDIRVVEVKQCTTPETHSSSFIVSYTTVGFDSALSVIGNVKPDLVLIDGDDAGGDLHTFLESLRVTTVPRLLVISRNASNIDSVKHLVDHIAFKPVDAAELVRIAYRSKRKR
jgi:DNA-binding response OmpR family regulator